MKKKLFFKLVCFLIPLAVFSQEETAFVFHFDNLPVPQVLSQIEDKFDVRFSYRTNLLEEQSFSLNEQELNLQELLDQISDALGLAFEYNDARNISIYENNTTVTHVSFLDQVIVKGYLTSGINKTANGQFKIIPKRLNLLPGLIEADVLESIQQLPSVISPNETATGLIVRGGRNDQNRVMWDGINIYHKGHLFGMISPFNPSMIEKVDFSSNGTHPRYGERTSSVIDISTNNQIGDNISAELGLNGLSADALIEIPIINNKLSIHGAARRSFNEVYESITFQRMAEKTFQSTKIERTEEGENSFFFSDYELKLLFEPNSKSRFQLSMIQIENELDYSVDDVINPNSFNDILSIENEGYSGKWNYSWNENISQETRFQLSKYRFLYNFIERSSVDFSEVSNFEKNNVIFDSGISSEIIIHTKKNSLITLGYQYALKDVSYAFFRKDDLFFTLDTDKRVEETHSIYGNFNYSNPDVFTLSAGLRGTHFLQLEESRIEPRLLVHKNLSTNLKLQLSGEIKNQIISEIDETVISDLSLENRVWRLADGETFPIINSKQLSLGMLYTSMGWSIDSDFYLKKTKGITALSLGFLNFSDGQFRIGEQRSIGADFYVKKNLRNLNIWMSYSFNKAENKYDNINDNEYFTSSNNIEHSFKTALRYELNNWQISLGWRWHSGKPFTGAMQDSSGALFFSKINTGRFPNYHRLDISSSYNFNFSKKNRVNAKVAISMRNVYDRENYLNREYFGNNGINDPVRAVNSFSQRFTPNLLFRIYW